MNPNQKRNSYYNEIVKASQNSDYEKALKSCNRLLHEFPDEVTAFEAKVVCYIHLSKFQEAVDVMTKTPKMAGSLGFEKSYCLYRLNKIQEAKETLEMTTDDTPRKQELMAQIIYRLEDYENCFDMYKEVIKNSMDEYEEERQTNLAAICACLGQVGSSKPIPSLRTDTYELAYNAASLMIAKGDILKAQALLAKAEELCTEFLREDGLADEEIDEELCIVKIQQAYCVQKLGKEKEALASYLKLLKTKPTDASLVAVASNNVLSINRDQNIFESKKRIKAMHLDGVSAKLTREQQTKMTINQVLFYLHTGQYAVCKDGCDKLGERYPEAIEDALLLTAALTSKTDGVDAMRRGVEEFIKKNPKSATKVKLCLIQDSLRQKNRSEAISMLKEILKSDYNLGIISALVVLLQAENLGQEAADTLKDAIQHFKSVNDKKVMNMLWRQAAVLRMQQGDYAQAVQSLEELLKATPDDMVTLAQAVLACTKYDMARAVKLSKSLPPPPQTELPDEFDAEGIETPAWVAAPKGKPGPSPRTPRVEVDESNTKNKKKKKKKPRLPKDFDPTKEVDPERWLPKYMRSGFKPKKVRKARVEVAKGTQGTAGAGQETTFDMSSRMTPGGSKPTSATNSPRAVQTDSPDSPHSTTTSDDSPPQKQSKLRAKKKR